MDTEKPSYSKAVKHQSLWLSFLAILVQESGIVPRPWKWHEATWQQLTPFDLLLLTSSQSSDKVQGLFWENVSFAFPTETVGSSWGGVQPSPQASGTECGEPT